MALQDGHLPGSRHCGVWTRWDPDERPGDTQRNHAALARWLLLPGEYQAGQTHDRRLVTNPRRDTLRLWRVGRAGGVHVTDVSTEHWEAAVRIPPDKRCQLAGAMLKQSLGDLALHAPRIHALDQRAA